MCIGFPKVIFYSVEDGNKDRLSYKFDKHIYKHIPTISDKIKPDYAGYRTLTRLITPTIQPTTLKQCQKNYKKHVLFTTRNVIKQTWIIHE